MKKTFFSMILGSLCLYAMAQETPSTTSPANSSAISNNPPVSTPVIDPNNTQPQNVQPNETGSVKDPVLNPSPSSDSVYMHQATVEGTSASTYSGVPMEMNYSPTIMVGLTRFAALPVLKTYVPEDVVSRISAKYGNNLYDIKMVRVNKTDVVNNNNTTTNSDTTGKGEMKTEDFDYAYVVRTQVNGIFSSEIYHDTNNRVN